MISIPSLQSDPSSCCSSAKELTSSISVSSRCPMHSTVFSIPSQHGVAPPPLKYIHSMSLHVISDTSGAHTAGVNAMLRFRLLHRLRVILGSS